MRHLRGELTHVDSLLPRVPALLNVYLDEITSHETSTRNTLGIPVHYAFPRLPASIVAELANTKAKEHVQSPPVVQPYTSDFTSETSSSEDSSTESSSDSDSDTEASEEEMPRRRRRPARQSSLKVHSRRVTDPISRKTVNRPRSHTTGFPFGVNAPSQGHPQLPHRGSDLANEHRVDPLVVLERVIEELEKVTKGIDEEAGKVQIRQEKVDAEINAVVAMVDEAQKTIDDGAYQQVRVFSAVLCYRTLTFLYYSCACLRTTTFACALHSSAPRRPSTSSGLSSREPSPSSFGSRGCSSPSSASSGQSSFYHSTSSSGSSSCGRRRGARGAAGEGVEERRVGCSKDHVVVSIIVECSKYTCRALERRRCLSLSPRFFSGQQRRTAAERSNCTHPATT